MVPEEIKLAEYINELSLTHKKFTNMGGIIMQANNQKMYVMDLLAFACGKACNNIRMHSFKDWMPGNSISLVSCRSL